jgi:predicted RNA-binding Zn-ribbon protein involved in translation (DUF1610 family)
LPQKTATRCGKAPGDQGGAGVTTGERAAPMFCPYCGEEQLRPWGDDPDKGHGDWRCEDCTRVFTLRYKGISGLND